MGIKVKLWETTTAVYRKLKTLGKYSVVGLQGGQSSSKTVSSVQHLCDETVTDPGSITTIFGITYDHLNRGALLDFRNLVRQNDRFAHALKNPDSVESETVTRFMTKGSAKIEFIALDTPGKALGAKRTRALMNEANLQSYDIYEKVAGRTTKQFLLDWNPAARYWFHENVLKYPINNATGFISNYTHNEYCPPETIAKLKGYWVKWKQSIAEGNESHYWKNMWLVYGLGQDGIPEGVCFPNVQYIDKFPDISELREFGYAMDWGWKPDPTVIIKAGITHTGKFVAELLFYDTEAKAIEFDNINGDAGHYTRLAITKDDAVIAPNDNMDGIATLQGMGWNILPCDRPPNSVKPGIDALNAAGIMVVRNGLVKHVQREQSSYVYRTILGVVDTGHPIDKDNHFWDACRYFYRYASLNRGVDPRKAKPQPRRSKVF